jgi:hypothetical protein
MLSAAHSIRKSALHLATILALIGCLTATEGCKEKTRASVGVECRGDTDCQSDLSCFESVPGAPGFCIPKAYAASDDDEEECLYRANCNAAQALRKVCPECILIGSYTCSQVTQGIDTPWYKDMQRRQERLESRCLKLRPEQIASENTDPNQLLARRRAYTSIAQNVSINGWGVRVPLSWLEDRPRLTQRTRQLANALKDVLAFSPPCFSGWTIGKTSIAVAGQCDRFRNPDRDKPPPQITLRRGKLYYRRGEPRE